MYPRSLKENLKILQNTGLKTILGKNVFKRYGSYMAGKDKERAEDLNRMFANKEIKAIFCTRGGFSSNRFLPLIDFENIKKNPKIFCGFSDISVLLNAIFKKTGLITFHWSNIELIRKKFRQNFKKIFTENFIEKNAKYGKQTIELAANQILKNGKGNGRLVGGTLWCLTTLLGTLYEPDWQGKILFWEEAGMTHQEIDFLLNHFKLAGVFDKISGMVIGKLSKCNILRSEDDWGNKKPLSIDELVLEITKEYKFPIITRLNFGHSTFLTQPEQIVLPIGVRATIDTSKKIFSIDEAGVK